MLYICVSQFIKGTSSRVKKYFKMSVKMLKMLKMLNMNK